MVGTPAAYMLATRRFRGRALLVTLVELPLVLPPAAAGIALLAAFGPVRDPRRRARVAGIELALQTAGVVVALTFVASPFYVRQAQAAFASVDPTLLDASRTLGVSEARELRAGDDPGRDAGPRGGRALALGRALGEFGATLMFAGSFQGITQTVPLAIYDRFATDFDAALALSAVLVAVLGGDPARREARSAGARRSVALRIEARTRLGDAGARRGASRSPRRSAWPWPGPSGAGKTSVLRIVAGLLRPERGVVSCGDETWLDTAAASTSPPERRRCGYVFQEYALFRT